MGSYQPLQQGLLRQRQILQAQESTSAKLKNTQTLDRVAGQSKDIGLFQTLLLYDLPTTGLR